MAVVETSDGLGSAFVVRHQDGVTLLVTNAHVVEGSQVATLKWPDGSQDNAAVVATGGGNSAETDLALLEVRAIRGEVLQIKPEAVNVGTDIFAIGAPKGLEFSISRGIVSGLRDDGAILQIDAAINPGNSGGPVLDGTGCVVGMATFKLRDSEGLNFALAASTINTFLAKPPSPPSRSETAQSPDSSEDAGNDSAQRPAEASGRSTSGPTCWFQLTQDSTDLAPSRCSVTSRRNANGHLVYDVIEPNGTTRTVVLWNDDSAEVILEGKRYLGRWEKDQDGDFQVHLDQGTFAFRY
ncbi:S1C family serine protease [Cyanobium gracile]|uniref:S1C family serine protease n=1 Tax=Cyanobium gracile TaxID=59930 RepID=UPI00155ACB84|nr:trypsin-like peptidase domain-containing protein [Cyanobium gracile]